MIDLASNWTIAVLVLLFSSLLLTLFRVKKRLLPGNVLRFCSVATLNVLGSLVLAAWLSNLSFKHPSNQSVVLNSELPGDPSVVLLNQPNLTSLKVEGYGLRAEQWTPFDGIEIEHQPPPLSAGLVDMIWDRQILLGNSLTVSGRYQQTDEIVTIKLLDPADIVVAETRVKNNETFQLTATPKALGHYFYRLNVVSEKDEIYSDEILPIAVVKTPPAKLLVVQSAPSFESKHLKNWASEQGASLLLLTTISKDRFIAQSVNMAEVKSREFSAELLREFDLLVMDGRGLVNLSAARQQWITQAVNNGLGLFVMADDDLLKAEQKPPIIKDLAPDTSKRLSKGKVALSTKKDSYHWLLSGDIQTYSNYWQQLLSQLARNRSDSRFIAAKPNEMDLLGARNKVCVLTDKLDLNLTSNDKKLNLAKDRFNPYRQCAFYWPQQTGWLRFVLSDGEGNVLDTTARYTFSSGQWQSWQQSRRLTNTTDFVAAQQQKSSKTGEKSFDYQPVNPVVYWWLLVFFASLLWVERKV